MAHAAGQVVRAKDNAVETRHGQNLIDTANGINMFDLRYRDDRPISSFTEGG